MATTEASDAANLLQELEPIRSPRTFESAVEQILGLIERFQLRAGDRLPTVRELSTALDISRPTTQQALRVLQRSGVVKLQRGAGGGVYVTSDLIPIDAVSSEVTVVEKKLVSLLEARRLFEGTASHLAALRATDNDLRAIERTIELSEFHQDNSGVAVRTDGMFHRALARAAHNDLLEGTIVQILRQLMPLRDVWGSNARVVRLAREPRTDGAPSLSAPALVDIHRRHLRAVQAADRDELNNVLHEHFDWLERLFAAATGRNVDDIFSQPRRELIGTLQGGRAGD